ncbi:MAG: tetratricopeptide repeat protein [Anaerolineae bacterium]|nr:tetratricopeptide repeat protein [Anaerolineae bacterium]
MSDSTHDDHQLLSAAWEAYHALRLDEAQALFEQILESAPQSFEGHLGLSKTYARQRRQDEAVEEAKTCIELAPERHEGYAALGALYFLTDALDEAREQLERALEIAPGAVEPRLTLSQVYADQGHYAEAEAELARAREATEAIAGERERLRSTAMAWHAQAYGLLAQGKNPEAVEAAQEAIALQEASPYAACLAYSNIGILEARARRYDQAIEYLERAYAMNAYFHRAGAALGRILILRRRPGRAAEVLSQVLQSMPEANGSVRHAYALALARSGQRAEALAQFRQALSLGLSGPDLVTARWQTVWLSDVGRYAVIGLVMAAVLVWIVVARPSAQALTFLAILALILILQRTLGRRSRS